VGAEEYLPDEAGDLAALRRASAGCRGCDLYRRATQTVFGVGRAGVPLVLVGEQPGDKEDLAGAPFVGPAGRVLDESLADAGVERSEVYVTNAVKHFKWVPKGKVRLHKRPSAREVAACRPWLEAEIEAVRPGVVVCLGATAARSLLGPGVRVTLQRGEVLSGPGGVATAVTVHPSSILRIADADRREDERHRFVADLQMAARLVGAGRRRPAPAHGVADGRAPT
jgi:uracil-DNA glycosylase